MIVVAGGTGFVGRAIVAELARRGQQVAILSHSAATGTIFLGGHDVPLIRGDVSDPASLDAALRDATTVVGAAQFKGFPEREQRQRADVRRGRPSWHPEPGRVCLSLRREAVRLPERRRRCRGRAAELVPRQMGCGAGCAWQRPPYAIFRPSWVFGPGDRALNRYVAFVRSPLPLVPVIGNGKQRLQPVFVEDVAGAVADSLEGAGPRNEVYEIGGPQVFDLDRIIRIVQDVTGKRKPLLHQPVWLMKALFSPKALIPALPLPLSPGGLEFATMDATADNAALRAAFPSLTLTPLRNALNTYLGDRSRVPQKS